MRHIRRRFSRARPAGRSLDLLRSWQCFPCNDNNSHLASLQEDHRVRTTTLKHLSPFFQNRNFPMISFWEPCLCILIIILCHTLCGHRPYGITQEMQLLCSSSKITEEETLSSPQQFGLLHWLVHRSLDSLSFTAKAFTLLPAHLHKHLEPQILHRQFKLFVFWVVWVSSFLQVKRNRVWHSG